MLLLKVSLYCLLIMSTQCNVFTVLNLSFSTFKYIDTIWKDNNCNPRYCPRNKKDIIMNKFENVVGSLKDMSEKFKEQYRTTLIQLNQIPGEIIYSMDVNKVLQVISSVEIYYNSFNNYFGNRTHSEYFNKKTIEDFVSSIISYNPQSIKISLDNLNELINRPNNLHMLKPKGFFAAVTEYYMNNTHYCEMETSAHQLMLDMFLTLLMSELKAYTMIQVSWLYLQLENQGNFTHEANLWKQTFSQRLEQQIETVVRDTHTASRQFLKCDPKAHVNDVTYTTLKRFMQGYIANEIILNSRQDCSQDCSSYSYDQQQSECYKDSFCTRPACKGTVYNCNSLHYDMDVCPASQPNQRRYDWIELYDSANTILGLKKKSCSRALGRAISWRFMVAWWCSFCMCYCDDYNDPLTHRFFDLRGAVSDVSNNKVVTGIRLMKNEKVIHFQIKQGELLENGYIENDVNGGWVPVKEYNVTDTNVSLIKDYHMMTLENRAIDIDDLTVPNNHLLTGIRFKVLGTHLNVEIRATAFNFTSGKLIKDSEKWISNDNTDAALINPRKELILEKPNDPIVEGGPTLEDSHHDQFMHFVSSDLYKDLGQNPVPFIDIQPVVPNPPVILAGAGIYHRGKSGSGGFLAVKVFTYENNLNIDKFLLEINHVHD